MSTPLWMKFGGASLADGAAVERTCDVIAARAGEHPAVVVSAHQGVTRLLEAAGRAAARGAAALDPVRLRHKGLLRQLGLHPELLDSLLHELSAVLAAVQARGALGAAELDWTLSFGERMSARVVAATLRRRELPATPIDAFDLGLVSDSAHGRARPLPGFEAAVRRALEGVPGVPVVTGFLARDARGALTTLGRNGSDLSAALFAEATGARELLFFKCVPGVMTADPREVADARPIPHLGFDEARALALAGADVLHPEALLPAERSGARVRVLDVRDPGAPGTELVRAAAPDAAQPPRGVAVAGARELAVLELLSAADATPAAELAELLALLAREGVEPRHVLADAAGARLCVPTAAGLGALSAELTRRARLAAPLSEVTLVGHGGVGLARLAAAALEGARVPVAHARLEPGRACFLVPPDARPAALRALHAALPAPGRPAPLAAG